MRSPALSSAGVHAFQFGLISYGTHHCDSVAVGTSMGVTAFSLHLITAAFHAAA